MNIWFENPHVLWSLVPFAVITGFVFLIVERSHRRLVTSYGEDGMSELFVRRQNRRQKLIAPALAMVSLVMLIAALADPVVPGAPVAATQGSLEVIAVIDVSNSMAAEAYRADLPPRDGVAAADVEGPYGTSLDMVKYICQTQVMPSIAGNRLGIIVYAGQGLAQAELTDDFVSLAWVMRHWMDVGSAPGGGSDYTDGLRQAVAMFDRSRHPTGNRVILLFSDGGFTGDAQALTEVTAELRERGIRLIVVGVGPSNPMPIPMYDERDNFVAYFPGDGEVLTTAIEEMNLRALVEQVDGEYVRVAPRGRFTVQWASVIAQGGTVIRPEHVYQVPLFGSFIAIAALMLRGLLSRQSSLSMSRIQHRESNRKEGITEGITK